MSSKSSVEEVIFWYNHMEAHKFSGMKTFDYCQHNNLNLLTFRNKKSIFTYGTNSAAAKNKKYIDLAIEYKSSTMTSKQFADYHSAKEKAICKASTYLNYQEIIDEHLRVSKEEPMSFKSITVSPIMPPPTPETEFIPVQNDIEIVIAKGVKVIIAPNIDPMKIIKIIELLKDI